MANITMDFVIALHNEFLIFPKICSLNVGI